jgi:hypothetical protein
MTDMRFIVHIINGGGNVKAVVFHRVLQKHVLAINGARCKPGMHKAFDRSNAGSGKLG